MHAPEMSSCYTLNGGCSAGAEMKSVGPEPEPEPEPEPGRGRGRGRAPQRYACDRCQRPQKSARLTLNAADDQLQRRILSFSHHVSIVYPKITFQEEKKGLESLEKKKFDESPEGSLSLSSPAD